MLTTQPKERVDGRRLRSVKSKDRVVTSLLDLLREGCVDPTIGDIARRAGVSERTVFRHYEDVEGLFAAAIVEQLRRIAPLMDLSSVDGTRLDRVAEVVKSRGRLFEEITPVMRAAEREAPLHPVIRQGKDHFSALLRGQVESVMAEELKASRRDERKAIVECLDGVTSWAFWDNLRVAQRLSLVAASAVMERAIGSVLLAAAGPERGADGAELGAMVARSRPATRSVGRSAASTGSPRSHARPQAQVDLIIGDTVPARGRVARAR